MTSISLLLAPWHLLASHLFGLLLIWHSLGRWWMHIQKPADKRPRQSFTASKTRSWLVGVAQKESIALTFMWSDLNIMWSRSVTGCLFCWGNILIKYSAYDLLEGKQEAVFWSEDFIMIVFLLMSTFLLPFFYIKIRFICLYEGSCKWSHKFRLLKRVLAETL